MHILKGVLRVISFRFLSGSFQDLGLPSALMWGLLKGMAIVFVIAVAVFMVIDYIVHRSKKD